MCARGNALQILRCIFAYGLRGGKIKIDLYKFYCYHTGMRKIFLTFMITPMLAAAPAWAGRAGMVERLGDVLTIALPAYALGMSMTEPDWTGTGQFAISYIGAQVSTSELQKLIAEPRPNGGKNGFPSGHATSAFSGAMFVHRRYGWRPALVPYLLAGFTAYSRVQSKWHYWHDVIGGAAVAGLWTWLSVGRHDSAIVTVSADSTGAKMDFSLKF